MGTKGGKVEMTNEREIIAIKKMLELNIPIWEGVPSDLIDKWVKENETKNTS